MNGQLFESERALIDPMQRRDRALLLGLGAAAIVCTFSPVLFTGQLPKAFKTLSLSLGVGCSGALTYLLHSMKQQEKFAKIIDKAQEDRLKQDMAHEIAFHDVLGQMQAANRLLALIQERLPIEQQAYWIGRLGLAGMVQQQYQEAVLQQAIPVQALPVYESAVGESPIAYGAPPVKDWGQPDDVFPVEDLAAVIAQMSGDRDICGSVLVACPKGTGKSNFLNACIAQINERHAGYVDFTVFNGKELDAGKNFCGLERSPDDYLMVGVAEIEEAYRRFSLIARRLKEFPGYPTVNILDEYNNQLQAAEMYDKSRSPKGTMRSQIGMLTYERITKGRSKLVMDLITSHSPFVKDIDLNTAIQESMDMIVLSRKNKTDAIISALAGTRSVVKNVQARDRLSAEFNNYINGPQFDPNRVVALTNLCGEWRLVFLPFYPDEQPQIQRGALNQTTDEVLNDYGSVEVDSFAYRYPPEWPAIASLAKVLTRGKCSYPGCCEDATEVHHARYQDEQGNPVYQNPQPGIDAFPLCDRHHKDRSDPECAHHKSNWIYGTCEHPKEVDSANTPQYRQLLIKGFIEKQSGGSNAA